MQALRTLLGFGEPAKAAAAAKPVASGASVKEPVGSGRVAPSTGPASNARHIAANDLGFKRAVPPQLTRYHVPPSLYEQRTPDDVAGYVASEHFSFLVTTLARGQLPNYANMCKEQFMNVLEVTEPLLSNVHLRARLIDAVHKANPNIRLVASSAAEFGGTIDGDVCYIAMLRNNTRIPFALLSNGFEPHRR